MTMKPVHLMTVPISLLLQRGHLNIRFHHLFISSLLILEYWMSLDKVYRDVLLGSSFAHVYPTNSKTWRQDALDK